ncbi:MAG: hypothetical protein HKP01_01970, partial [Gemmatimonadetes bacterium]|nr:hypothetical protein [Gemmatimonadota bacterium]
YLELSGLWARSGDREKAVRALQEGRRAVGSDRLFVQELASLQANRGSYPEAAAEWRSMLAWGPAGVEAVQRGIDDPGSPRTEAVTALRLELASPKATVPEQKGGLQLALALGEFLWAREIAARLAADLPEVAAIEIFRDYVGRARDAGDVDGAAWAAESLADRAESDEELLYWTAAAADLSYELGDLQNAKASFARLVEKAQPGSDLHELSIRRLHELLVEEQPDRAASLLREHQHFHPEQTLAGVEMSVRSARAWLRRGQLDRAREAIASISPDGVQQAARQAAVLGWIEILAGRPAAARGHLELAATIPTGEPGTRIGALELLGLVEAADSAGLVALGIGVVAATASGDPGALTESVTKWAVERTPGGAGLAGLAAEELHAAGYDESARSVRVATVDGWPGSPEAARALLDLARMDRTADPMRAVAWLERLIVEYPESAMAPIARRFMAELRRELPEA